MDCQFTKALNGKFENCSESALTFLTYFCIQINGLKGGMGVELKFAVQSFEFDSNLPFKTSLQLD